MSEATASPVLDSVQARCLCEGITIRCQLPARFVAHCHCRSCRRAHAAPMVTWAGFLVPQCEVTTGSELLTRYQSSPQTYRSFCARCGTTLLFESARWAGELHVAASCLDRLPMEPTVHAFYEEHVPWLEVPPRPREDAPAR